MSYLSIDKQSILFFCLTVHKEFRVGLQFCLKVAEMEYATLSHVLDMLENISPFFSRIIHTTNQLDIHNYILLLNCTTQISN